MSWLILPRLSSLIDFLGQCFYLDGVVIFFCVVIHKASSLSKRRTGWLISKMHRGLHMQQYCPLKSRLNSPGTFVDMTVSRKPLAQHRVISGAVIPASHLWALVWVTQHCPFHSLHVVADPGAMFHTSFSAGANLESEGEESGWVSSF